MSEWVGKLSVRIGVAMVTVAFAVGGCIDNFDGGDEEGDGDGGRSCESLCAEAQRCEGADPTTNCREDCARIESLVRNAGCSNQLESLIQCSDSVADICTPTDACSVESSNFSECLNAYCQDHIEECTDAIS